MVSIEECRQFLWDFQNWHYENKDSFTPMNFEIHQGIMMYYIRKLQLLGFEFAPLNDADGDFSYL